MGLEEIRAEIDKIDCEMAALFERRMQAASRVAKYKEENNLPVKDPQREDAVLEKNAGFIKNKALLCYYKDYMRQLMGVSRQYQTEILGKNTVCYQGGEGGFGHFAAQKLYPHGKLVAAATFAEVFGNVQQNKAFFGVVPFENTTTGDVADVLDLCFKNPECSIVAMFDLRVSQNLLGVAGANIADVKEIYSHPQALEQSSRFLANINAQLKPFANTALAAKYVAETGDKSKAAIASLAAAKLHKLVPLAKDISTETSNTTRFIVVGKQQQQQGGHFALLLNTQHQVGSLAKVISEIASLGFNMENIKSRPMPGKPWEYYFYIEIEGTPGDKSGGQLLQVLGKSCSWVRLLGRYNKLS